MASLLEDYRKRQAWANLGNIGQGLLMASAQNMPLSQGLAYGLAQMEQPGMREELALQEAERKQMQLQAYNDWMMGQGQQPAPQPTAERLEKEGQSASLMGGAQPSLMGGTTIDERFDRGTGQFRELTPQDMAAMGPELGGQAFRMAQAAKGPSMVTAAQKNARFLYPNDPKKQRQKDEEVTTKAQTQVDLTGLPEAMTASQRGKEAANLRDARVKTTQMVQQGANLISNLRQSGNQAVSWSGAMARGIDTLQSQGQAIARNFGIRMSDGSISKRLSTDDWNWGDLASESSVIKSQILGLAVAITKADQGSRPSDFDVQTSINRIAGNAGSASRMADTIEALIAEKSRDFEIYYNDLAPAYKLKPFSWEKQLKKHKINMPGMGQKTYTPQELQNMSDEEFQRLLRGQ